MAQRHYDTAAVQRLMLAACDQVAAIYKLPKHMQQSSMESLANYLPVEQAVGLLAALVAVQHQDPSAEDNASIAGHYAGVLNGLLLQGADLDKSASELGIRLS